MSFYHQFSVLNSWVVVRPTKPSRLIAFSLEELTQNRPCGRWHANRHHVGFPERDQSLSQGRKLLTTNSGRDATIKRLPTTSNLSIIQIYHLQNKYIQHPRQLKKGSIPTFQHVASSLEKKTTTQKTPTFALLCHTAFCHELSTFIIRVDLSVGGELPDGWLWWWQSPGGNEHGTCKCPRKEKETHLHQTTNFWVPC